VVGLMPDAVIGLAGSAGIVGLLPYGAPDATREKQQKNAEIRACACQNVPFAMRLQESVLLLFWPQVTVPLEASMNRSIVLNALPLPCVPRFIDPLKNAEEAVISIAFARVSADVELNPIPNSAAPVAVPIRLMFPLTSSVLSVHCQKLELCSGK
jgi:hypothetical protein